MSTDPAPPPFPARRARRWPVIVGIAAMLGLVATGAAIAMTKDPVAIVVDEWDERVVDLVEFVETERGLTFERPVQVDFLTPDEFSKELRAGEEDLTHDDREEIESLLPTLRAVGLLSGEFDVTDTYFDLLDTFVAAFYDIEDRRIVVPVAEPTGELTVETRVTLVHELVHALQDQHFDLDREFDEETVGEGGDAAALAEGFTALVEGDATRIEAAYVFSLPGSEFDEYLAFEEEQAAELDAEAIDAPSALTAFMSTPYLLGWPLVEIIAVEGGNDAVDDAFEAPPWTGEHLLDPMTYLDGKPATDLATPALPSGVDEPLDEGQLGAVDVYLILAERIDPFVALDAADSWGNALYATYEVDERTCVRVAATGDTQQSGDVLQIAFDQWVAAAPSTASALVTDDGAGTLMIESCDPGPDTELAHDRAAEVLLLPAIRSNIVAEAMEFGDMSTLGATELADCFVRQFSLEQLTDDAEPQDEAIAAAVQACGGVGP